MFGLWYEYFCVEVNGLDEVVYWFIVLNGEYVVYCNIYVSFCEMDGYSSFWFNKLRNLKGF